MRRVIIGGFVGLAFGLIAGQAAAAPSEASRWRAEAAAVTIVRDDWGIAHVHGRTDAEAVFGMIYAQAEDDFHRVETNYVAAQGRLAEAEGEKAVYQDLRMRLFVDPADLRQRYARSPAPLKALMGAWADALNFYLSTHPAVHPRVIKRFEPWMALSFTEGSIGADFERVQLKDLERFYGERQIAFLARDPAERQKEPTGSNGIAIAPANTVDHHALLLINPHTSFFFRSELQVTSNEGLNAYGAATWGQPFLYQGFNDRLGWMHTTSGVDAVDEFAETVVKKGGAWFYRYGGQLRPVTTSTLVIPYKTATGMGQRTFTVYRTHHGPIVRERDGKWVAVSLMNRPVEALSQGFLLTKAKSYGAFMRAMALKANSSNNTIYADADGNIAYMHPQFIPKRDDRFDYTHPVDGSDPATDWHGLHALDEAPHLFNPPNGWIFNTNNWPYSAAGYSSPKRSAYPRYMDQAGENPRGQHATLLLTGRKGLTLEGLNALAYDSYLPAFAETLPSLFRSYDALGADDPLRARLKDQVAALRGWNFRWGADSVPTSLAVFWGEALWTKVEAPARRDHLNIYDYMANHASSEQKLDALVEASDRLKRDFGTWRTPWGEINRFQRNDDAIVQRFDDAKPSIPVPFTSARWGSLASFGAQAYGTKKWYGTSGNSFVAVVEFGPRIRAKAVTAGGESGDVDFDHFDDEAERYASGRLRDVYFYPDQLKGHTERRNHTGC
jgi:acyl-homoserine-lactone acylase